jgi:hypothetical protein
MKPRLAVQAHISAPALGLGWNDEGKDRALNVTRLTSPAWSHIYTKYFERWCIENSPRTNSPL